MDLRTKETELLANKEFKDLTFEEWDIKIKLRGIAPKQPEQLEELRALYKEKIPRIEKMIFMPDQNSSEEENEAQKIEFEEHKTEKIARLKDKYSAVLKEIEFREKDLVVRDMHHTIYYLDHANASGTLTGTWTFTNASTAVSAASDGNAVAELAVGDYIQPGDNTAEWYRISTITDDDNLVLTYAWNQATVTDTVGTTRYSDISVNDGTTTAKAFVHIREYTTDLARSAGDILYVRANKTYVSASVDIVFDEDGTLDAYTSIIGCDSVTNDPWTDSSDVKPIIDFQDRAFQVTTSGDHQWWIERIVFEKSNHTLGTIWHLGDNCVFKSCEFQNAHTSGFGIRLQNANNTLFDDCDWLDCRTNAVFTVEAGPTIFKNCRFTAGTDVGTDYALKFDGVGVAYLYDTTFAGTFDNADIFNGDGGVNIYARNVNWSGSGFDITTAGSTIWSEDDEQVFEAQLMTHREGTIARDTATVHAGGADSSAKMISNVYCGLNNPLTLGDRMSGFAKVWATKDVEIDISIYASVGSAWDSALSATEAYARYSYLSNAASAARTEVQSTETIANDTTWTAFTSGAITPLQTGWVYIWFYLAEYEDAGEHIFVDIKPVVN